MSELLITFPALQNGIIKTKDETNEPYNFVSVVCGHAVVVTPYSSIFLDLKDYFVNYITLAPGHREPFDELMNWMEGKHFTSEFWSYLTSWNTINVIDDKTISISGDKFVKELKYTHDETISINNVLNLLVNNSKALKYQLASIGVSNYLLKIIDKTVGKIIQRNSLIFEFISLNSTIRFTVDSMPCIFGIILSNNALTTKQFIFDGFKNFALKAELKL